MTVKSSVFTLAVVACLALSACESSEEKAAKHFQSGMSLLESGDVSRAVVEFKNVLKLNAIHKEARVELARIELERGFLGEAIGHYLALAEVDPDNVEARRSIAEIAIESSDWELVEYHGRRAIELDPEDARHKAIQTTLDYKNAVQSGRDAGRRDAAEQAQAIVMEIPESIIARRIIVDNLIRESDFAEALTEVDNIIAIGTDDSEFYQLRLSILNELGMDAEIEEQLVELVELFPKSQEFRTTLFQWYVQQENYDAAETFLRDEIEVADDKTSARLAVADFVGQVHGPESAREVLVEMAEVDENKALLQSLIATFDFDMGDREGAIAQMQSLLVDAEPSEQTRNIRISLARMLSETGDVDQAAGIVEDVLSQDGSNVEALKLRAQWQIENGDADQAILTLRTALDLAPQDAEVFSLIADAHIRNGDRKLAGEMLSLAVETTRGGAREALNYAGFLISENDLDSAETVLADALRQDPGNLEVLSMLGNLYLELEKWESTQDIENQLRSTADGEAIAVATNLEIRRLERQNRVDEALDLLDTLSGQEGSAAEAAVEIVRYHISTGDFEKAKLFVDRALTENPEDRAMRYFRASLFALNGRDAAAERLYRELLAENNLDEVVWRSLYITKRDSGEYDEAAVILNEALEIIPTAPSLLWLKASAQEIDGEYEAAIATYEMLYDIDNESMVVANNLASLIGAHRTDPADLSRAYSIARILRGSNVPAFQDTVGWLALQNGNVTEALRHLESAAEGMPDDPVVRFHLASAYAKDLKIAQAISAFEKVIELAGGDDSLPQAIAAREELDRLQDIVSNNEAN